MSTNVINQSPYLRTSREFPYQNLQALGVEINRSYIDISQKVNDRTIGIYPVNVSAITGESWYLTGSRQQTIRQVYAFSAAGTIAHGITLANIYQFTKPSGTFTDGTNWYGALYASNLAITGQVSFYITPTNIVVLSGAGAPAISRGTIVLEWMTNVQAAF